LEARSHFRHAVLCALTVGLALPAASALTRVTCKAFGHDCPYSITGRAGCYRIAATYELIPQRYRNAWLEKKTAAPEPPDASAFTAMAKGGCWTGPHAEISKEFPNESADRLMNAAFFSFLFSPDEYSFRQMMDQLSIGLNSLNRLGSLGLSLVVSAAEMPA